MARKIIQLVSGEKLYHVVSRGNNQQAIFHQRGDYVRFIHDLYEFNNEDTVASVYRISLLRDNNITGSDPVILGRAGNKNKRRKLLVEILAFCLMPNHFHILLKPAIEEGVQSYMQKLSTGYSMYFNKRYERTGSLFEGKYKSQHAGTDEYLKYLFAYIHLNPVKLMQSNWQEEGITNIDDTLNYLKSYVYSSFLDYADILKREEKQILSVDPFPKYYDNAQEWIKTMIDWLSYSDL